LTQKYSDLPSEKISKELSAVSKEKISPRSIRYAISNITKEKSSEIE